MNRLQLLPCLLCVLVASGTAADNEGPSTVEPDAELQLLFKDDRFFEGPTWDFKTEKIYFTSFPLSFDPKDATHILRWDAPGKATIWLDDARGINGTYLALDGRLLGAQVWSHRVMSYDIGLDGPRNPRVLYANDQLLQPNDVCQSPSGDIYFSDPDFDHGKNGAIYLLRPNGEAKKVIESPMPNGLIMSLDGGTLYVGENHFDHWLAYPVKANGEVGEKRVFFQPAAHMAGKARADGMTIDEFGNLYLSGECCFPGKGGVWVVSPEGESLGRIPTPEFCSNVTFGDKDGRTLFLTCKGKLYSIAMSVRGGQFVPRQGKDAAEGLKKGTEPAQEQ